MNNKFLLYLASGGVAALANYGSRFFFGIWFVFEISVVLAFVVGLVVGFFLMRSYVFQGSGKPFSSQVFMYVTINMFGLLQTVAVSSLMLRVVLPGLVSNEHAEAYAHAVGISVPIITSYFGHKFLTFR